jgi:hypothetical protein
MLPVCAPIFGSRRHSSSAVSLIRSTEVTRVNTLEVIRKTVQEPCPGKGKRELKRVSKSSSDLQNQSATLPKDRDGISVIEFSFPGMWTGVTGQVPLSFIRSANARTSCAAITECREANRLTQLTVGSLSLNTATRRSRSSPHTSSITRKRRRSPAISKSELVIVPRGLEYDTNDSFISLGHSQRKTVGGQGSASPNTTPPTPCPDASFTPIKSGHPPTSSLHRVGATVDSRSRVRASLIA